MTVAEIIGKRVRQAREEAGLTQRELGERIAAVLGRPWFPQAISAAEKGRRDWTAEDLVAVAWVLRRQVQWFFTVDEQEQWLMLDVPGHALIHAGWAGGVAEAPSPAEDVEEIAVRVARLRSALARPATAAVRVAIPTPKVVTTSALKGGGGRKP
jgi:transcriptional regulator with XRE-family HTH domain